MSKKKTKKKKKTKTPKKPFANSVRLSKTTIPIGKNRYPFWPKAILMDDCEALDPMSLAAGQEGDFGRASELSVQKIQLWIPELKISDALMYSCTQLAVLAASVYAAAIASGPGDIEHSVVPKELSQKIGEHVYKYYPSGLLLSEVKKLDDARAEGASLKARDHISHIRIFIPSVKDKDLDRYSMAGLAAVRDEILKNAVAYVSPTTKKGLRAFAKANAKTTPKTVKKAPAKKKTAKRKQAKG